MKNLIVVIIVSIVISLTLNSCKQEVTGSHNSAQIEGKIVPGHNGAYTTNLYMYYPEGSVTENFLQRKKYNYAWNIQM